MKDFGNGARILDAGAEKASKSQGDSARGVLTEMAGTTKGILTLTGSARWRTQSIWSALLFSPQLCLRQNPSSLLGKVRLLHKGWAEWMFGVLQKLTQSAKHWMGGFILNV